MTKSDAGHSHAAATGRVALWRKHWPWLAMLGAATAAAVLGYIGLTKHFTAHGQTRSPLDILYLILCLFFVDSGEVSGPVPWQLGAARLLAAVVPAWAIITAAVLVFHDQLQIFRLQLRRGHVVVCGLGRRGLQLVHDFRKRGSYVVAIDKAEQQDAIRIARELGALVLVGNATDEVLLAKARVAHAGQVVAISGDDGANVEVAMHAYQLVRRHGTSHRGVVRCLVQIADLELCNLFRRHRVFADTGDPFEARIFNTYENAARLLLQRHPLDRVQITADDPRTVHLAVVGFGRMGQSLALQAARTAHYANSRRLRVTAIDRAGQARQQAFLAHYPQFGDVCDAEFLGAAADDPAVLERLRQIAGDPCSLTSVAVCLDDDSRCLSCALEILSHLGDRSVPIFVRMAEDTGLATLLEQGYGNDNPVRHVHPFGMTSLICTPRVLFSEDLDLLARAIHDNYLRGQQDRAAFSADPALRPWQRLDLDLQDCNRYQADHIPVKLRAVGCYSTRTAAGDPAVVQFTAAEVELLARMEHARWTAERRLAGWTHGIEKCPERKTHPCLVPWNELPDGPREHDRQAVRNIPRLLEMTGEKICRRAPRTAALTA